MFLFNQMTIRIISTYLVALSLSFLIYEMGMAVPFLQGCREG